MRATLRVKLFAIVAVAALGLVVILIGGTLVEGRVERHIATIREQYIPKIGLADQLQNGFDRVTRRLQDAADAADLDVLQDVRTAKQALLDQIAAAPLDPTDAAALRAAIDDYHAAAEAVTRKMIVGDTSQPLVGELEAMQGKRARVAQLIEQTARFDEQGLRQAFDAAADAQTTGARIRLAISLACLLLVVGLTLLISRGMSRNIAELATGFRRFGDGDFAAAIPVTTGDELGGVVTSANQMADRLARLDRVRVGAAGLAEQLRGELEPEEVGDRAVGFLARYLGAPAGVLYYAEPDGVFRLIGRHGVVGGGGAEPAARFTPGDGVLGEAARRSELTVIAAPAGHLPLRSGLVDGEPRALVLLPLVHGGVVTGIVELALLAELSATDRELLVLIRDSIAIAVEVARARASTRALLAETQRQASELMVVRRGLEEKAAQLARASTYKSQFLANMSHELRTPLNAILGFSELMYDGAVSPDSPQHKEFLGDILNSGRHLLQLINDVLDLSKVEAGKLEFRPERVHLSQLVDEVLAILRTTAATARVTVEARIEPGAELLTIDAARLKQVLYNFLSNAIKFTPEGGRVTIRATGAGDSVRIEVEDTGVGISEEDQTKLFTEFHQLREGKKKGGTGLGLALTRRLAEAQGGSVGVTSTVGKGSVFHVVLPRIARPAKVAAATLPPPFARDGRPTVLVIEDDARDRVHLVDALTAAGYAVEVAASGAQAIARCGERSFDAVTLDLLLPDMTGLEVLRQLRAGGLNQDVPVIVITVVAEKGAVAGFAVADILPKPLDGPALLAALTRAGVPATTSGTIMVVDDDPGSLRLMETTLHKLGYQTRCEADAETALRAAHGAPPSAIVLDLLMPGMSGFEFLERLRRDPAARRVPVIVWTGKDLSIDERARLRASANAVVTKDPAGGQAVVAELAAFLPSSKVAS